MMLTRYDPSHDLDGLRWHALVAQSLRPSPVPIDAYRNGDSFVVALDLPGVNPNTIDLSVKQNVLTIKAERSWQRAEGDEVFVAQRSQGTFSRQLILGDEVDRDNIKASYDYGVLTVKMSMAEAAKARKIEITSGGEPIAVEAEAVLADLDPVGASVN